MRLLAGLSNWLVVGSQFQLPPPSDRSHCLKFLFQDILFYLKMHHYMLKIRLDVVIS